MQKKCGNCTSSFRRLILILYNPGVKLPSKPLIFPLCNANSFKRISAKAPLSRAMVSVGPGPGGEKERNAEQ